MIMIITTSYIYVDVQTWWNRYKKLWVMWGPSSSERKWERNRLYLTKSPRSSFFPCLAERKMTDMIDSCQSCDFLLLYWNWNRKARLALIDVCCDMNWHRIRVIIAMIRMCSCIVFSAAGTLLLLGASFLPLDACIVTWLFQSSQVVRWLPCRQRWEGDGHVCWMAQRFTCWEGGSLG